MAKRARGTSGRPGQRRSNQRSASRQQSRPASGPAPSRVTSPELVEATVVDDDDGASERPATASRGRTRTSSASFEVSAAQEYAYVAADVRRIAIVGGSLFGVLFALFILIEVLGVIHL